MKKDIRKLRILFLGLLILICGSCVSIPQETIRLSKGLGEGLVSLHEKHRKLVLLYYQEIEKKINDFIDNVYVPYIINFALKKHTVRFKEGKISLLGVIQKLAENDSKENRKEVLKHMKQFKTEFYNKVNKTIQELLHPIRNKKEKVISYIDKEYELMSRMNLTITSYLKSVYKLKKSQEELLITFGTGTNAIEKFTQYSIEVSEFINNASKESKDIDIESDEAPEKIGKILSRLKEKLTN